MRPKCGQGSQATTSAQCATVKAKLTAQNANGQESGDGKVSSTEDLPVLTGLNPGYTINLHLPATSDIAVYNAIFKSLREHLLE